MLAWSAVLIAAAACGDNHGAPRDADPPDPDPVTIGGTVSGLVGSGLVLTNGGDELAITGDGSFVFATRILPGASYEVSIATQPASPTQHCVVSDGAGVASTTPVTNVTVTCTTASFTVGGIVSGLTGTGLVLENNGTDSLAITGDGAFAFATPVASGSAFAITIAGQPVNPTQTCTVSGGTGVLGAGNVTTVVIDCAVDRFTVGGLVSGLDGGSVELKNNGGDTITVSSNGGFAFPATIASTGAYAVTVSSHPTTPSQTCVVTAGSGTVTNADISSVRVDCTTNTFTVGGTVGGLAGTGLALENNAGDTLAIAADGSFTFSTPIASGEAYAVTVRDQPTSPSQVCSVGAGSGVVGGAPVTDVAVTCVTSTFTVGGTVSGLTGAGLVLRNNGGDDLSIDADGSFTFTTPVASGATFAVTVGAQPTGPTQTCTVSGGSGTVGAGPVTSVTVDCAVDRFTIGGTISGLRANAVLQNNGGDDLTVSSDGTFAFSTAVASGDDYEVTVRTQPSSPTQTCTVANGTGTVTSADITSVAITCVTDRFTVGVQVTGLAGTGLVLRNGGDSLPIASDGSYSFPTEVESGATYAVSVDAQPTNLSQTCVVTNGSGAMGGADVVATVTCTTDEFEIRGTVSGLAGTGLVLRNNGTDDLPISTNGTFEFATRVPSGGSYAVTVLAQPTSPSQTCVVTAGSGPVTNADITTVEVTCTTNKYRIGGTVSGLLGTGLILTNNGGNDLAITGDGSFVFSTPIESGSTFTVAVASQPSSPTQTCVVMGETGTVGGSDVTSVVVDCTTDRFTISGTISGLEGTVVLQNNGGDDLPVTADGMFAFSTSVASGSSYEVTVETQPGSPAQTCVVTNESGTVTNADIDDVVVTCTTNRYRITGTLSGLAANSTVVLRNNGADDLPLTANGGFAFSITVPSGGAYAVTVLTNPSSPIVQTCDVTRGSGVVGAVDVTDVAVACTTTRFIVRAKVTGLTTGTLVLQNNLADDLATTTDGTYPFSTPVASGAAYSVTVRTQPAGLTCRVTDGSGTIGNADVTATVTCRPYCFEFSNDSAENLTNNNWFDTCATDPGNTITVTLRDTSGTVVYQASGSKVGTWSPYDFLTSTSAVTQPANMQYHSSYHDRMIALDNGDRLMIPGRAAAQRGCGGSLGDGYGIVIYPSVPNYYTNVKLMIQPYRQMNLQVGTPRLFAGWTPSTEIIWNGGTPMNTCMATTPFLGTFTVAVTP